MVECGEYIKNGNYYAYIGDHSYYADLKLKRVEKYRSGGFYCFSAFKNSIGFVDNSLAHTELQDRVESAGFRYINLAGRRLRATNEQTIATYEKFLLLPFTAQPLDTESFKRTMKSLIQQCNIDRYVYCSPKEPEQIMLLSQTDAACTVLRSDAFNSISVLSQHCGLLCGGNGSLTLLGCHVPNNCFQAMKLYQNAVSEIID